MIAWQRVAYDHATQSWQPNDNAPLMKMCVACRLPFDGSDRRLVDTFKDTRTVHTADGPRRITREFELVGEIPDDRCSNCGTHHDRPVRYNRNRNIGGKRGRNSGKVSQHGKKG